jgi:phosphoserine phosphatase RsbU/P
VLTPNGTITGVNRTFLDITGYEAGPLIGGRTFASLLTAGGRIYHETHYAPMLRMQGIAHEIALELVRVDGQRLPVLVSSVVDRDAAGEPWRIRTSVFAATERREYERELLRAKQRAEASEARARSLAVTLQKTLIPHAVPHVRGLDLAAIYRPAGDGEQIGGDFFDVFQVAADDWLIAVGDVQGKGVDAAVVTALARYTIRAAAVEHDRPRDILHLLNDTLRRDADRYCTAVVLRCRRRGTTWHVSLCCAGHPLPILRRVGEPPVEVGRPGSLLGFFDAIEIHDVDVVLDEGDAVVVYTDGVTEARHRGEFFGEQRVNALVAADHPSAADLADRLLDAVLAFQHGVPRDDIAIVVVGIAGEDHLDA